MFDGSSPISDIITYCKYSGLRIASRYTLGPLAAKLSFLKKCYIVCKRSFRMGMCDSTSYGYLVRYVLVSGNFSSAKILLNFSYESN